MNRLLRFVVPTAIAAVLTAASASLYAAAQDFRAPGQPKFDCTGMSATAARLRAGLPLQDEWIKKTEAQLKAAEDGYLESKAELMSAFIDGAKNVAEHYLSLASAAQDLVENTQGFSSLARHDWKVQYEKVKFAGEAIEKSLKSGAAGYTAASSEVAKARAVLDQFKMFLLESGIGDEATKIGAEKFVALKLLSPQAALMVEMLKVSRDALFAGMSMKMTADEADAARRNLEQMKAASQASKDRIYELEQIVATEPQCTPPPRPDDRIMVRKDPDPPAAGGASTPPARTPAATSQRKPPSAGKMLGTLVVAGAAGVGTYYYLDKKLNIDGGGSNSVKVSFGTPAQINCTFNAGGIINSCTGIVPVDFTGDVKAGTGYRFQFDAGPGGNRTISAAGQVQFSITGGTGSQTCPTLRSGAVIEIATQLVIGSSSNLPVTVSCK